MFSKKFYIIMAFTLTSCVQDAANIIYKESGEFSSNSIKKEMFQPSYMRGTYIKTTNNKVVRDLRKNETKITENEDSDAKLNNGDEYDEMKEIDKIENNRTNLVESNISKEKQIKIIRVKNGDSLSTIAERYDMSLKNIAKLNNIKSPYRIYVGQRIKVYDNNKIEKTNIEYKTITVKKGDSLIKIALTNNSTLREIASINDIKPPYNVYIGQKIKVPVNSRTEMRQNKVKSNKYNDDNILNGKNYYVVKRGDNLYSISKYVDVSISDLIKYNNLKKPYKIFVGQKLYVINRNNNSVNNTKKSTQSDLEVVKSVEKVEVNDTSKNEEVKTTQVIKEQQKTSLFDWPVKGEIIKKFGKQADGEYSDAITIKSPMNTPILAAGDGEVAYAGNELKGFGNIIIIKHSNGWLSIYGYCDKITVKVKDKVSKGQTIGTVGQTGNVSEPQLYFSVRKGRVAMDPVKYLD